MDSFDDPTPTQKIWLPISDLQQQHSKAFLDLQTAMFSGDLSAAEQAHAAIAQIEQQQQAAHAAARRHVLGKISASG